MQRPAVFGDEYRGVGEGKTLAALCVLRVEAVLLLFRQFVNPVREPDVLIPHKGAGVITAGSGFQHSSFVGVRPRLDDFLPALAPVRDGGVSLESGELRLVVPKAHVVENADGGDPLRVSVGLRPEPDGFPVGAEQHQTALRPEAEAQVPAGAHEQQGPGGHIAGVFGIAPIIIGGKAVCQVRPVPRLGVHIVPPASLGGQQVHVDGVRLQKTVHHRLG